VENFKEWEEDYAYNAVTNEFEYKGEAPKFEREIVESWFSF
jgi:hypothetical protein